MPALDLGLIAATRDVLLLVVAVLDLVTDGGWGVIVNKVKLTHSLQVKDIINT